MKKSVKRTLAIILTLVCVFAGILPCFALEGEKVYKNYKNYVLIGDSSVSGFEDNGPATGDFVRVDGSFSAIVADTLGVENFYPRACRGFRTVEYRYMLEDDFVADEWLFAHTDKAYAESMRYQIREDIANADLITMGVGGNDFGAYIGWLIDDMLLEEGCTDDFVNAVRKYLEENNIEITKTISDLLDMAQSMGHLDEMIKVLPEAIVYTLSGYVKNWDILIQDIYDLNPDVELYVMGIYNNSSVADTENLTEAEKASIEIQDLLVEVANKPMIDGIKKFGYTFVETNGTVCDIAHPTPEGHKFLAERVLEALPDARFPYTDVDFTTTYFQGVHYMYVNELMTGISDTVFGVDEAFTKGEFAAVLNKIDSSNALSDSTDNLTYGDMAFTLFGLGLKKGNIVATVRTFVMLINILSACKLNITSGVNKATAAEYIYDYINL